MPSSPLSTPVSLELNLPALQPGQHYQLTLVNDLRRSISSPLNRELDTYFQRTIKEGSHYVALGAPQVQRINLHQAVSLKTGTLWTNTGERYLHSQQALPDYREFSLGPATDVISTSLGIVLPELNSRRAYQPIRQFLTDSLLNSMGPLPVTTLTGPTGELLLIPQFELIRAFYLWVGPKFIDFLFHPTRTSHICSPVQAPTVQNKLVAKVLIRPSETDPANVFDLDHRFSAEQVLLLAQMRFDAPFRRAIEHTCVQQEIADSQDKRIPLGLELALSRQVTVKANGISFAHRGQRFFWVCSLFGRGNYFCFDRLEYTSLVEYRSARKTAIANSPTPPPLTSVSSHLDLRNRPRQNSNQAGNGSAGSPDVFLDIGDELSIPVIEANTKAVKQELQTGRRGHRTLLPVVLTQRGGGQDPKIARVNMRPAWEVMNTFNFKEIIREFRAQGYTVSPLQLNNERGTFGKDISVPADTKEGTSTPYQVGIACVQRPVDQKTIYGYFFQVLHSSKRRSAFLHRTNLTPFTPDQFNWVLQKIQVWNDDWVKTRKEYEAMLKERVVAGLRQEGIEVALVFHARNHTSIPKVVALCISELVVT